MSNGPAPTGAPVDSEEEEDDAGPVLALVATGGRVVPKRTTRQQVDAYLRDKRTVGAITAKTSMAMRWVLMDFAERCPEDPSRISRRDVLRWLKAKSHLSAGTRWLYQTRAKGFTDWLLRRGVLRRDPFLEVPMPKVPRAVPRTLERDQAEALLAACVEPRDLVVVILGLHTGLRRAELAALEIGDLNLSARTVFVRCGKGGHQRVLPLSEEAALVVGRYVAAAGLRNGPLLRSLSQPHLGIRPGTVSRIFDELARRAGVKVAAWDKVGCHSLRHTAATGWYQSTSDVLAVRDLLGHMNLSTTERYVKGMNVEGLRAAVEGRSYLDAGASL